MTIQSIIGFLSGSLVTLVIREIINQYNRKQDFEREIRKLIYVRKLEVAEKAIAVYYTYKSISSTISTSHEFLIETFHKFSEGESDVMFIKEIIERNQKALFQLSTEKFLDINNVHLYFDLEDETKWSDKDSSDLLTAIGHLRSMDSDLIFWNDLYSRHQESNPTLAQTYLNQAMDLVPDYLNLLKRYLEVFQKNITAVSSMVTSLKEQVKKI